MSDRLVLWDFDGTLAHRTGMWRGAMIETLDEHLPGHGVRAEQLRPFLHNGFPWHRHEQAHPELADPEAWWAPIYTLMADAYEGVGINPARARELARHARTRFVDPAHGWALFDDVIEVLTGLRAGGLAPRDPLQPRPRAARARGRPRGGEPDGDDPHFGEHRLREAPPAGV